MATESRPLDRAAREAGALRVVESDGVTQRVQLQTPSWTLTERMTEDAADEQHDSDEPEARR